MFSAILHCTVHDCNVLVCRSCIVWSGIVLHVNVACREVLKCIGLCCVVLRCVVCVLRVIALLVVYDVVWYHAVA